MKTWMMLSGLLLPAAVSAAGPVGNADRAETAAGRQDKIVCKRFAAIGSLIESERVCRTKREWENSRANLTMKDPLGSCNGAGGAAAAQGGSFCGR